MIRCCKFIYTILFLLALYFPIMVLITNSFNASKYGINWGGFTLEWYQRFLHNPALIKATINSLTVSTIAATLATIIGCISVFSFFKYDYRFKKLSKALIYLTLVMPEIVMGISFLICFMVLQVPLGFITLLIAHIAFCLPFVVITILTRLKSFDKNIIEAAKDLGASDFCILWQIIVPIIFPTILSSWLLAFIISFDDVVVSHFVTGPTFEILPLVIYSMAKVGVKPEVNAICAIILFLSISLIVTAQLLIMRNKK
ncbi:spermidine/putrescine ABC transporter permease PotC [Candidatus Trichorickettsia mobilis]|uniref:spermidine/putrescine ABC transporter permease PotC n=1 Tax=Candidatus Trichorickettsia mobilis TaxID=1346319 RepID=UPI00292E48CD|nr:spermidine/putrescine ABC transporter permease PotC [Candidatus Trichorickettsia mobilis]